MIKYEAEEGNVKVLSVDGNVIDITTDVAHMIHLIYECLKEQNETAAKAFKKGICILADNIVFGECHKEEEKEADSLDKINKRMTFMKSINSLMTSLKSWKRCEGK